MMRVISNRFGRLAASSAAAGIRSAAKAAALPAAAASVVLIVLAAWVLGGGFGTITREHLEILDARVPLASTPGLTAVYLTVRDTGAEGDELLSASSPGVHDAMLMGEHDVAGAGVMERVDGIAIPAHGSVALSPFADDITLEGTGPLRVGRTVTLTLTFRNVGTVTVSALVVAPGTP